MPEADRRDRRAHHADVRIWQLGTPPLTFLPVMPEAVRLIPGGAPNFSFPLKAAVTRVRRAAVAGCRGFRDPRLSGA